MAIQNPKILYNLNSYSLISKSTLLIQSGMTLSDNNGNQQSAANAKLLLQEIIGMDVPLEHLAYWLKGQPAMNGLSVGTNHLLGAFTDHVDGSQWTAGLSTYPLLDA